MRPASAGNADYHSPALRSAEVQCLSNAGLMNHPPSVLAPGFCLFRRAQRRFAARASFFLAAGLIVRLVLPPGLEPPEMITRRLVVPSTAERISAIFSSSSAARRSYPTIAASNNSRSILFGISANYNRLNTMPSSCPPSDESGDSPLAPYFRAVTVISMCAPPTSFAIPTVVRVGRGS